MTQQSEEFDMDQLLDEAEQGYQNLYRGQVVDGVIMKVDKDGVLVNVGQKTEGVVPSREMRTLTPAAVEDLKEGDPIVVAVVRPETDEGQAVLSLDRARGEMGWRVLLQHAQDGSVIEAPVTGFNKGGAVVTAEGVQGFVPLSQLTAVGRPRGDGGQNEALEALVGTTLKVKVIEVNRRRNRAILSERAATQESRAAGKAKLLADLQEGELKRGVISGTTNFGAFVDLGGADGLIHISELSWQSVRRPEDVVNVGDEVEVLVVKVDQEAQRIALSLKRTKPEPWAEVPYRYHEGQIVPATVTKLATFGAFARIEDGIEGLIHISELADRMIQHPREVVTEGNDVMVKIVRVDPARRRIGLSLKQVDADAESGSVHESRYSPPDQRSGPSESRFGSGEAEHRVERPALDSALAAQLVEAVSAGEKRDVAEAAQDGPSDNEMSGSPGESAPAPAVEESERVTGETA